MLWFVVNSIISFIDNLLIRSCDYLPKNDFTKKCVLIGNRFTVIDTHGQAKSGILKTTIDIRIDCVGSRASVLID